MSSIIILPSENIDNNGYINSSNFDKNLMNIFDNLDFYEVETEFPKFKVDFSSNLVKVL